MLYVKQFLFANSIHCTVPYVLDAEVGWFGLSCIEGVRMRRSQKKRLIASIFVGLGLVAFIQIELSAAVTQVHDDMSSKTHVGKYDSLIRRIKTEFYTGPHPVMLQISEEAYRLANADGDEYRIVQSGRLLAQVHNYHSRSRLALTVLRAIESKASNYQIEYWKVLMNKGLAYTTLAEYDSALNTYSVLLKYSNAHNDVEAEVSTMMNIAFVHQRMGNHREALVYHGRILAEHRYERDLGEELLLRNNMGFAHFELKEFDKAESYFRAVLDDWNESLSATIKAAALHGLGKVSLDLGRYENATTFFNEAILLSKKHQLDRHLAENIFLLGCVKMRTAEFRDALSFYVEAESMSQRIEYYELLQFIYADMATCYNNMNQFEKEAEYLKKHLAMKDKIYGPERRQAISSAFAKHAVIQIGEQMDDQKRALYLWEVTALICCFLVAVVLFKLKSARSIAKKLQRRLVGSTRRLESMSHKLNEKQTKVSSLITVASQQINAPLATLKGMCNLAILEVKDDVSKEYFTRIDKTTEELQSIVNRISSGGESGFDLASVVDEIIITAQQLAFSSNVDLQNNVSRNVIFNCSRKRFIRTVTDVVSGLMNTCDNACVNITFAGRVDESRNTLLLLVASDPPIEPDIDLLVRSLSEEEVRPVVKKLPNCCYEISLEF
jgi:tetratricopeptide (TPR) repeat protein